MESSDQGLGTRGWELGARAWGSLILMTGMLGGQAGLASSPKAADGSQDLRIAVQVCNLANAGESTVIYAEREAERILKDTGVQVAWINCPMDPQEAERNPVCRQPGSPATLVVRIVVRLKGDSERGSSFSTLGSSVVLQKPGHGTLAAVSYHRVSAMTSTRRLGASHAPYLVLGVAMAHEIGHLLLGRNGHAPSGLMRAAWNDTDLQSAALGHLNFSPEEAVAIRAEVRDRLGHQEVTKAALRAAEMAPLAAN